MASNEIVMHFTVDDISKVLIESNREALKRIEMLEALVSTLSSQVAELLDGLDAWSGRIQRLEALPGVTEALKHLVVRTTPEGEPI